MQLIRRVVATGVMLTASLAVAAWGQSDSGRDGAATTAIDKGAIEIDFLFNYYNQDGENSAVTGGIGTEAMDVVTPTVVLNWQVSELWTLNADLGADAISSASVDAIDDNVSSASEVDTRAHTSVTMSRETGRQTVGFSTAVSTEYDYNSLMAGLSWARDFNQDNTTLAVGLRHYEDVVDLYDIDGVQQGEDDRTTTDFSLNLTQVLSKKSVGAIEISVSDQSGFLSTPFHEVILAPADGPQIRIAERLPDSRSRTAVGLRYNYAFSKRTIGSFRLRGYDDDWGVQAFTIEVEPHFKWRGDKDWWIFPILRHHDQEGSDYFGGPATFDGSEQFFTADRDLSTFTSQKYGVGWKVALGGTAARRTGWSRFETRLTYYTRSDGLESISTSFAFGWSLR